MVKLVNKFGVNVELSLLDGRYANVYSTGDYWTARDSIASMNLEQYEAYIDNIGKSLSDEMNAFLNRDKNPVSNQELLEHMFDYAIKNDFSIVFDA